MPLIGPLNDHLIALRAGYRPCVFPPRYRSLLLGRHNGRRVPHALGPFVAGA